MAGAKDLIRYSKELVVLYIEDDDKLREDTLRLLLTFFKEVVAAVDGQDGLDKYQPGKFDIVISDLVMPVMDGAELAKTIKAINQDQIVIILSAHDEQQIVAELSDIGVDDFIFKPLEIQQFIDTLYKFCSK